MMKINYDTITFIVGLLLIGTALLYAGLMDWLIFWLGFLIWLVCVEYYCEKNQQKTLSERFGDLIKTAPRKAYMIIALFWLLTLILTWHLISMGSR